jgi:histidinol-phosphate/aromatic aminotransferase/cobyric acid decarboxylase-like protein
VPLPLDWASAAPGPLPELPPAPVLWITNPHNPTGQLWSRAGLEPLLRRHRLVICDEAFLSLVPDGERQSLIPLVAEHANLVVIRSLTKLYGIAGLGAVAALGGLA